MTPKEREAAARRHEEVIAEAERVTARQVAAEAKRERFVKQVLTILVLIPVGIVYSSLKTGRGWPFSSPQAHPTSATPAQPTPQPVATPSAAPPDPETQCDDGIFHACYLAGARYRDGVGVEKDDVRAAAFFAKACDGNDAAGCTCLGGAQAAGRGVAKSAALALATYKRACNASPWSCLDEARAYESGAGVAKDHAKAMALLTQSCTAGNQDACADVRK
jgi:hypothetical protein